MVLLLIEYILGKYIYFSIVFVHFCHLWLVQGQRSLAIMQAALYIGPLRVLHADTEAEPEKFPSLRDKGRGKPESPMLTVQVKSEGPTQAFEG